jgi:hypothetical protein
VLNHDQADLSLLLFSHLKNVSAWCKNDSDLQFIATILENSIPSSGHGFLNMFEISISGFTLSSTDCQQLCTSLTRIVEVCSYGLT